MAIKQWSRALGYLTDVILEDDNWELVPAEFGRQIQAGDEFYNPYTAVWVIVRHFEYGAPIKDCTAPIRRRVGMIDLPILVADTQRWSCSHGREDGDSHCRVCIVFSRNITS